MQNLDNPLLAVLFSAAFTGLIQSSSATTGVIIVLASQGFITLEAGITLAFGANIGTCVTAALAALGQPREAAQAAGVHLLFNVVGVLIWIPFIGLLAELVVSVSPTRPDLDGAERLAAETPRQIANAHTVFNIANTLLFIWFTGPIAALVTRLLPERPEVLPEIATPKYLQDSYLQTPALALDRIRLEIGRLGEEVGRISADVGPAFATGTDEQMQDIAARTGDGQRLFDSITDYARRLSSVGLTAAESRRLAALTAVASHVQHIAETNAVNVMALGRERLRHDVTFSPETIERMRGLGRRVRAAFDLSIRALEEPELAAEVIEMKPEIQALAADLIEHLARRLTAEAPDRALLYRIETQAVEIVQREYYFAKKIAKTIAQEAAAAASADDHSLETELREAAEE